MQIRSITQFAHPRYPISELVLQKAGTFTRHAKAAFESAGYPVQTVRLATPPFPDYLPLEDLPQAITQMGVKTHGEGFDYVSLGPADPGQIEAYSLIPQMLKNSGHLFFSGHLTTSSGEISLPAVRACAEVIHRTAPLEAKWFCQSPLCSPGKRAAFLSFLPGSLSPRKSASLCVSA